MWDQSVARPLSAHTGQHKQNKRTQTSMPQVGFEPTIPVFERAKTAHALDRAANVLGFMYFIQVEKTLVCMHNAISKTT
jgi:hypothetical protein